MINCNVDYHKLIENISKRGLEVNGTYELVGEKVEFAFANTESIMRMFDISEDFENEFLRSIYEFNKKAIGPYITEKYFMLIPSLKEAAVQLSEDCNETRRAVINFPKEHCFQSIQFLVRENTVNVVCYMRSCNAIKNLPYDAWLCYKLADIFAYEFSKTSGERPYEYHKVIMMFGSLHVFKEDITHEAS